MNKVTMKEMLFEHFSGRSTALQRTMITEWLQDASNRLQYVAWLDEWERQHLQYLAEEDTALNQLTNRINGWEKQQHPELTEENEVPIHKVFHFPRWLVAASIALCLLSGLYIVRDQLFYKTIDTAFGETRRLTLPDGSLVTLNANSSLRLPRFGFGNQSRTVWLTGEAAFSVRHTPTHQRFIVHTHRGVDIEVLGTEFNVADRPGGTKVVLSKGAIQLNYADARKAVRQLRLKPGDEVNVDLRGKLTQSHTNQPEVSFAWQDHRFVFNSTTVHEIVELLRDNYNLRVVLKNSEIGSRTVTGSFQAHNADEFLQVVAELLEINYRQKDDTVTFFE